MRCAAGGVMVALALLPSLAAVAAEKSRPAHVALELDRQPSAASCPSRRQLQSAVSTILGRAPFDPHARRVLRCKLWEADGIFHARLQLRDRTTGKRLGVRELSSNVAGCAELAPTVALAIALAVDPLARPPAPAPAPSATGPPSAPGSPGSVSTGVGAAGAAAHVVSAPPASRPAVRVSSGTVTPPPLPPAVAAAGPQEIAAARDLSPDAGPPVDALAGIALAEFPDAGRPAAEPDAGRVAAAAAAAAAVAASAAAVAATPPDAGPPLPAPGAAAVALAPDAGVAPAPGPEPEPGVGAAAERPPSAEHGEARPWHGIAGIGGDWTWGLVPSSSGAFGPVVHGGVAWSFASIELEVRWLPSTSSSFNGGTVSTTLVTGALVGCALFGGWGACGLLQVGPETSSGQVLPQAQDHSSTTWVVALGARGQYDWVFAHPVGLRVHLDGMVNLVRPRLVISDTAGTPVVVNSQGAAVALAVGAGLFVVF